MGIRTRFNEIFGLEDRIEEERKRFVERINFVVFDCVHHEVVTYGYDQLFANVCYELGVNGQTFRREMVTIDQMGRKIYTHPQMERLTNGDFNKTIEVLCALYEHIRMNRDKDKGRKWLSAAIEGALSRCTCDIGVRWKEGFFYPSGAEELDKPLIEDVLTWLKDYPSVEKDYRLALRHYSEGQSLSDVMTNCHAAVEGIAQCILGNTKNLDSNKEALLTQIGVSKRWGGFLANYIKYTNDHRHTRSGERHNAAPQEVEACLYMTGLIIRLTIESKKP